MSAYDTDAILHDEVKNPWQDMFDAMGIKPSELESWQVLDIITMLKHGKPESENGRK